MASAIPSSLGRYEVLEELGKGAMGVVYLARDPLIGRLVALKTFRASQAMHGSELIEYRTRFMREAQSAGILSHPHIVTIHDVVDGADGSGVTFIAMEYVRGVNLKELLMRGEAMPLDRVCDVVSQLGEALDYAHSKGVIHRDIKPANIIIDAQGKVKITDFGIARLETSDLTHEGQLLGTPNYMAPERILGHKVDHRTDIFSLGVVLYEMLTRQKPFQGENLTMVSHRIVYEPFTPPRQYSPGLPPSVVAVLEQALEKQPERRFNSAGSLAAKLREAVTAASGSETTVAARPPLPPVVAAIALPPLPSLDEAEETGDESAALDTADVSDSMGGVRPPPPPPPAAAPAPRAQPPSPGLLLPPPGRLVLLSAAGLAVVLLIAAAAFAWVRAQTPAINSPDAADRGRARYRLLLQEARSELDAGRPEAALAALARAMPLAPGDPDLERMGLRIRSQLAAKRRSTTEQQAQLQALLESAQAALRAGDAARAADLAQQVLALVPGEPNATALLANAQAAAADAERRRRQQAAARPTSPPGAQTAPTRAAAAPVAPVAPAPGTATQPATLRIEFFTELPEGVLTIYAGQRQILGEPFRFYKRTGLFRNQPSSGQIDASRQLQPGATTLRVYVALPKRAPVVTTVQAQLAGGTTRLLKLHFDQSARLSVSLQ